jgi:hypothetical protein
MSPSIDTALALLGFLSYNYQKQAQINTVIIQQIKVDRVGFEPTTSAMPNCIFSGFGIGGKSNKR